MRSVFQHQDPDHRSSMPGGMDRPSAIAAIAIGRNEGQRLVDCLEGLKAGGIDRIVYVDSGSTDGSAQRALERGIEVVSLDMSIPFTAARARNAGLQALAASPPDFVQLIDGDSLLVPGWIAKATRHLERNERLAMICGLCRERHPETSIYNRHCDREWQGPIGTDATCGGNSFARYAPLLSVGGFDPTLIAGEEPDLCLRLRREGWQIERLDADMVLHDAAITRFSQFWRRSRRAGHAYAEGQWRHRHGSEGHFRRETRRALFWGAMLPLAILGLVLVDPLPAALLALAYPAQFLRLAAREGFSRPAIEAALLLTLAKFAEAQGAISYHWSRLRRRRMPLIEYK